MAQSYLHLPTYFSEYLKYDNTRNSACEQFLPNKKFTMATENLYIPIHQLESIFTIDM